MKRYDEYFLVGVHLRVLLSDLFRDAVNIRLRLLHSDARFKTRDDSEKVSSPISRLSGRPCERRVEFCLPRKLVSCRKFALSRKLKVFRKHANDCVGLIVEDQLLADNVGVRAEPALPQSVADCYDVTGAGLIFFGKKSAALLRFDSEQ